MLRMFRVELDKYLDALLKLLSMFSQKDVSNSLIGCETLYHQRTNVDINFSSTR